MLQVMSFTFGPFSENTYVLSNEQGECIIFDPGMYQSSEEQELERYLIASKLKPVLLINTHCHIDHIMGNTYCAEKFGLNLQAHSLEKQVLDMGITSATLYGLNYNPSVPITHYLTENDCIVLGEDKLKILFTPGHSPGSLSFYSAKQNFVISGDVLFRNSIGRTDLPGGDYDTLINSIKTKLLTLPGNTTVYSGHGPSTTIEFEVESNPFLTS
jgi:glyoxylase-like metal-dependent hydrolase (beta-lactamase superfamily II)